MSAPFECGCVWTEEKPAWCALCRRCNDHCTCRYLHLRVKASDIPELPVLEFLAKSKHWCNWFPVAFDDGTSNPESVFHAMPADTPPKVGLAKMRALIKKKLVEGCACGCRGDFQITDLGREFLKWPVLRGCSKDGLAPLDLT